MTEAKATSKETMTNPETVTNLEAMGTLAKQAERALRIAGEAEKTKALELIAEALIRRTPEILKANEKDLSAARGVLAPSMIDRLTLTADRIGSMADAVIAVSKWKDPVGRILETRTLPNGLVIEKRAVPLGVIGIIFEARPNVTSDCAALCIKSGNACILRGGREAFHSNTAITNIMRDALADSALDINCVQLVEDTSRKSAEEMMTLTEYLDVLIPRGGAGLIRSVVENAKVPVIETGAGNCHIYVDKDADFSMALDIIFNAKTSRPSVCNAAEKVLVHRDIAEAFLPAMAKRLAEKKVALHGDRASCEILGSNFDTDCNTDRSSNLISTKTDFGSSQYKSAEAHSFGCTVTLAEDNEWGREYLDFILGVKVIDSPEEAIEHIERYSTRHSECIITENADTAEKFLNSVDAAAVYHNASTRFTDGGEMGLGAEIGISTQKLHARGPMGVGQLVSYKYVMKGNGQIR